MKFVLICGLMCVVFGAVLRDRMALGQGTCRAGYALVGNVCVKQCNPSTLGDGKCNTECNNEANSYDGGDCIVCDSGYVKYEGKCYPDCPTELQGNGNCEASCNYQQYNWDNGDCE